MQLRLKVTLKKEDNQRQALKNKNCSIGSFVNVFKVTDRNQLKGLVIADVCEQSGIQLRKNPSLYARICPSSMRKIKTFADLYSLIHTMQ